MLHYIHSNACCQLASIGREQRAYTTHRTNTYIEIAFGESLVW